MKNTLYIIIGNIFLLKVSFAKEGGITGLPKEKLRKGDVHTSDIPIVIKNIIDFGIYIAGTIAIIFIIIGAYKILFGSLQQDKTKGKDTIIMAIGGFLIAVLAWSMVEFIFDNFD